MITQALRRFSVVAFTHKTLPLEIVGKFHIDPDFVKERLTSLKTNLELDELMYLSTCNRVEFMMVQRLEHQVTPQMIVDALGIDFSFDERKKACEDSEVYRGEEGVKHLFKVSASLDSMVIGEREIITQVRKSFEDCRKMNRKF